MLLLRSARGARASSTRAASTRALSTAPQFDEAMAKAYNIVAENHRHKDGPWSRMRDKVVDALEGLQHELEHDPRHLRSTSLACGSSRRPEQIPERDADVAMPVPPE